MPCKCVPSVDITIYRKPGCREGRQAHDFFECMAIAFKDLDVSEDPQALRIMRGLSGQTERPVIVVRDQVFVGFHRAELEPVVPSWI
jgi:glutaredoxin